MSSDHEHHDGHEDHIDTGEHELTCYEKRMIATNHLLVDKSIISSREPLSTYS